ncbi:MAG: hypothetical protein JW795_14220 [Chitinivibrionales bacterium]|nr:hypothetical protein [Chitinivibrionales bacterium]
MSTATKGKTESHFDYLMDLSVGGSFAMLFNMKSSDITVRTEGASNFILGIKLFLHATPGLYFGLSVSNNTLKFHTSSAPVFMNNMKNVVTSKETLNYLAFPLYTGYWFERWFIMPFVYGTAEPSLLTGASRHSKTEISILFPDNTQLNKIEITDSSITKDRKPVQCFLGMGAGIEIPYNYGAISLSAEIHYALVKMDCARTNPTQISHSRFYVPLTIGVRFYL